MMKNEYSAHPALASEQLYRAERNTKTNKLLAKLSGTNVNSSTSSKSYSQQHRRHNSAGALTTTNRYDIDDDIEVDMKSTDMNATPIKLKTTTSKLDKMTNVGSIAKFTQKTLPDRTTNNADIDIKDVDLNLNALDESTIQAQTKDCLDCAETIRTTRTQSPTPSNNNISNKQCLPAVSFDETDHIQNRFSRNHKYEQNQQQQHEVEEELDHNKSRQNFQYRHTINRDLNKTDATTTQQHLPHVGIMNDGGGGGNGGGDGGGGGSAISSAFSSPSASTVSSPLSTPTRLAPQLYHSHQHCCQKSSETTSSLTSKFSFAGASSNINNKHHHHHHHHHQHQHSTISSGGGGCKKSQKFDPRLGPSPYRQLLPIALCILSFATVFSILIVYMDTTEITHQQFKLNMSRDYNLYDVAQDDQKLVAFLREIHMRKYPLQNRETHGQHLQQSHNFSAYQDGGLTPKMANYVANLLGGKMNGASIQSLSGTLGHLITAPWLAETLNWAGIIIEPETRRYFTYRKQNAQQSHMQVVHACVSPNTYPKEITVHNEESEVRISSLHDEFNSRVKCFPLYTIMLACNRIEYDLLSLGVHGHELEILQTLPFDKVKIEVISIHMRDDLDNVREQMKMISKFLLGKLYKLQMRFDNNYFYQRINTSTSRTRKKDILLLKTP